MKIEDMSSIIGKETNESESYAFKIGFNAAVVTTFADALSDNSEMRMDTLVEAVAAEFAAQFDEFDDRAMIIDDFLCAVIERILEHIGNQDSSDPSLAAMSFNLTLEFAAGRKSCGGYCKGCSYGCDGD